MNSYEAVLLDGPCFRSVRIRSGHLGSPLHDTQKDSAVGSIALQNFTLEFGVHNINRVFGSF
jgi:hypothetical protein